MNLLKEKLCSFTSKFLPIRVDSFPEELISTLGSHKSCPSFNSIALRKAKIALQPYCTQSQNCINTVLHSERPKLHYNPIALRRAKIAYNFGLSECNRVIIGWKSIAMYLYSLIAIEKLYTCNCY